MTGGSETSLIGTNQTMGDIARQFQDLLKTPVVHETGVEGSTTTRRSVLFPSLMLCWTSPISSAWN